MPNLGMGELIVVLVIVLVLFGAKRLPEVAKGIGKSLRSFKEGMNESESTESKSEEKELEKK